MKFSSLTFRDIAADIAVDVWRKYMKWVLGIHIVIRCEEVENSTRSFKITNIVRTST